MLYRFLNSRIVPKVYQATFEALNENGEKIVYLYTTNYFGIKYR